MTRETQIVFAFENGEYDEAIMFEATYPWYLTDKEKSLTEEKLHNIIWAYAEELGLEEKDIVYCEVSYWS